jgi:hypothetical protein
MRTFDPVFLAALLLGASLPLHAQPASFVMAACGADTTTVAQVTLPRGVLANGERLPAGRYELRLTTQHPEAAPGAAPDASCWMQFVRDGTVAGREVASVIPAAEIASVAKRTPPARNTARVEALKDGDYVRVWVNHEGTHYLLNLPAYVTQRR